MVTQLRQQPATRQSLGELTHAPAGSLFPIMVLPAISTVQNQKLPCQYASQRPSPFTALALVKREPTNSQAQHSVAAVQCGNHARQPVQLSERAELERISKRQWPSHDRDGPTPSERASFGCLRSQFATKMMPCSSVLQIVNQSFVEAAGKHAPCGGCLSYRPLTAPTSVPRVSVQTRRLREKWIPSPHCG